MINYRVGDDDTTPDVGIGCHEGHESHVAGLSWRCTRDPGHEGNHAAGNGDFIGFVWDQADISKFAEPERKGETYLPN